MIGRRSVRMWCSPGSADVEPATWARGPGLGLGARGSGLAISIHGRGLRAPMVRADGKVDHGRHLLSQGLVSPVGRTQFPSMGADSGPRRSVPTEEWTTDDISRPRASSVRSVGRNFHPWARSPPTMVRADGKVDHRRHLLSQGLVSPVGQSQFHPWTRSPGPDGPRRRKTRPRTTSPGPSGDGPGAVSGKNPPVDGIAAHHRPTNALRPAHLTFVAPVSQPVSWGHGDRL